MATSSGFDAGRLLRTLALIAVVTGAFMFASANVLSGTVFSIAVAAIGSIGLVTAITAFVIAAAAAADTGGPR